MASVKINDEQLLYDGKIKIKQFRFATQQKDGKWKDDSRYVCDHGNAVSVLLYNKEKGTVVLTRQFRLPSYLNGNPAGELTETCAGLLEDGENPDDGLKREIKEETGYAVDEVRKVYEAYTSPGFLTERILLYVAAYKPEQRKGKGGGLAEEGEQIQVLEMPFREAMDLLDRGEIKDAKTIILLQYAQLKGLL